MDNPYSAPSAEITEIADNVTYQPEIFAMSGRIGRLRYIGYSSLIMFLLFVAVCVIGGIVAVMLRNSQPGAAVAGLAVVLFYVPLFAVQIIMAKRRLHDLDSTGWLSLLIFVPLVNLLFGLYLWFAPGTNGRNRFGPAPAQNPPGMALVAIIPVLLFVLGILAAVAIPAYQKYVTRAKAAQLEQQAQPAQNSN